MERNNGNDNLRSDWERLRQELFADQPAKIQRALMFAFFAGAGRYGYHAMQAADLDDDAKFGAVMDGLAAQIEEGLTFAAPSNCNVTMH